jgi:muramoyltetrapeptide carboxypeptidase
MRWNYLKAGDIVDIIAPASHSPETRLDEGVEWLRSLGLAPRLPHDLIDPDLFFAASLEQQLEHLQDALHSDSKAIWCLRGGYGSMRLIPYLKKMTPPKKPKLFIGFSDITSLHLFFNQNWNWPTLHARTISQLGHDLVNPDRRELAKIIRGKILFKDFKRLKPLNSAAREEKSITGKVIGGNLRILQSSLGTEWEVKPKGKILFIEDVAERGYSVDRMLEQMHQAKLLDKGLKALVVGDFTEGVEKDGKNLVPQAIARFAQRVDYPVLSGLPCGHGKIKNHALPFNTKCLLQTGKVSWLRCDFGGH